jgi:DNA-binding protein H-NS
MNPLLIAAAIQTLQQAAVSFIQIKDMLAKPDITPEQVKETLDATDADLQKFKDDDRPTM